MSINKVKIIFVLLLFSSFRAIRKKTISLDNEIKKMTFACIYEAHGAYVNKSKIEQERKARSK